MTSHFAYSDLSWYNLDPDSGCLDLAFGAFLITVKGRGLAPIFSSLKRRNVAWIKEATSEMEDHKDNECFIEEITVTPPEDFSS